MKTRQAKSISKIRAERREAGLCAECGSPSQKFRCAKCRPKKSALEISKIRRAAVMARWS